MNAKKIVLATAAGASLLAALPASAHRWDARHRPHYYRPPAVVYVPARPVVVAPPVVVPAPVYYQPAPVYYAPPAPVLYGRIPVAPGLHLSFGVRL